MELARKQNKRRFELDRNEKKRGQRNFKVSMKGICVVCDAMDSDGWMRIYCIIVVALCFDEIHNFCNSLLYAKPNEIQEIDMHVECWSESNRYISLLSHDIECRSNSGNLLINDYQTDLDVVDESCKGAIKEKRFFLLWLLIKKGRRQSAYTITSFA